MYFFQLHEKYKITAKKVFPENKNKKFFIYNKKMCVCVCVLLYFVLLAVGKLCLRTRKIRAKCSKSMRDFPQIQTKEMKVFHAIKEKE